MPRCPKCGYEQAREIAPGYYECENPDDDGSSCHHRFQTGLGTADSPLCQCGTFAIGRCYECGQFVCGDHSKLVDERRVCDADQALESQAAINRHSEVETMIQRMAVRMAANGNPGTQLLGNDPHGNPCHGWVICFSASGAPYWLAVLVKGEIVHLRPTGWQKIIPNGEWKPIDREVKVFPGEGGLIGGTVCFPDQAGESSGLVAIPRRLDEICAEHGLPPVSQRP